MAHNQGTGFRPPLATSNSVSPPPLTNLPGSESFHATMGGGGQVPIPMSNNLGGGQPAMQDKAVISPQSSMEASFSRAPTLSSVGSSMDDRGGSVLPTLQAASTSSLGGSMMMGTPRKSRNPRVVHRHLYLWIEDQIEKNKSVPGLMVIESLETFYREVLDANEGNEQFNFEKLLELAQKQPPVSLLYDRTLNTSTNVLKRWNNTNGMLNWFLHKVGRASTPDALEVVQLARIHVAKSVMKKQRTTVIPLSQLGGSDSDILLGKRKMMEGRPVGGLCHVEAQNKKQLFENLKTMYPGVKKQQVMDAVDEEAWLYHAEGSYAPNPQQLQLWSEANGLWQHFAAYCRVENIKHDAGLFGGENEGQPRASNGAQSNKKMAVGSSSSSIGGFPAAVKGTFPVTTTNTRPPAAGGGGGGGGMVKPGDGTASSNGVGGGGGMVRPDLKQGQRPYLDYFNNTLIAFENQMRGRIEACGTDKMAIRFVDSRRYGWDENVMEEWGQRWVELGVPEQLTILMPYVVLIRRNENTERDDPSLRALSQSGSQTEVRQVGVYTFKYGTGYYLHVTISLVCFERESRKARFTGRYILSNADDVLLPCDCGPVSIDPNGTADAQPILPEDYLENQGLYFLSGGVSAAQDDGYTSLRDRSQARKIPISLVELLTASGGREASAEAMGVSAPLEMPAASLMNEVGRTI